MHVNHNLLKLYYSKMMVIIIIIIIIIIIKLHSEITSIFKACDIQILRNIVHISCVISVQNLIFAEAQVLFPAGTCRVCGR